MVLLTASETVSPKFLGAVKRSLALVQSKY